MMDDVFDDDWAAKMMDDSLGPATRIRWRLDFDGCDDDRIQVSSSMDDRLGQARSPLSGRWPEFVDDWVSLDIEDDRVRLDRGPEFDDDWIVMDDRRRQSSTKKSDDRETPVKKEWWQNGWNIIFQDKTFWFCGPGRQNKSDGETAVWSYDETFCFQRIAVSVIVG